MIKWKGVLDRTVKPSEEQRHVVNTESDDDFHCSPLVGARAVPLFLEEERAVISLFSHFLMRIPSGKYLSLITTHTRDINIIVA